MKIIKKEIAYFTLTLNLYDINTILGCNHNWVQYYFFWDVWSWTYLNRNIYKNSLVIKCFYPFKYIPLAICITHCLINPWFFTGTTILFSVFVYGGVFFLDTPGRQASIQVAIYIHQNGTTCCYFYYSV